MGVGPVEVTLTMEITGNGDDDRTVTLAVPGQEAQVVTTSESRSHQVSVQVAVPPGSLEIRLRATGDIATTPGSEGKSFASLKVSDLRLTSTSATNVASLQQFAAASPAATR
jgi:hypothetical protein